MILRVGARPDRVSALRLSLTLDATRDPQMDNDPISGLSRTEPKLSAFRGPVLGGLPWDRTDRRGICCAFPGTQARCSCVGHRDSCQGASRRLPYHSLVDLGASWRARRGSRYAEMGGDSDGGGRHGRFCPRERTRAIGVETKTYDKIEPIVPIDVVIATSRQGRQEEKIRIISKVVIACGVTGGVSTVPVGGRESGMGSPSFSLGGVKLVDDLPVQTWQKSRLCPFQYAAAPVLGTCQ